MAVATSIGAYLIQADTGVLLQEFDTPSWVRTIALSPDGALVAIGYCNQPESDARFCGAGTISILGTSDGMRVAQLDVPSGEASALMFAPGGAILARSGCAQIDETGALCLAGEIVFYDTASWQILRAFRAHNAAILDMDFSPDGQMLVTAGEDGAVRLWSWDGALLQSFVPRCEGSDFAHPIRDVSLSPDGAYVGAGGCGAAFLWDVVGGSEEATLQGYSDDVSSLAFSPDGRLLATGGWWQDSRIILWRFDQRAMVYQTEDLGAAVSGLAFSPDGLNLASVDAVNGVVLRETASGRPTSSEIPLWNYARTVAFSPDGLVMAVASQGGIVEERGPRTGNLVARYDSLGDYVYSLAYRADGSLVALTCRQGDLRVRDGRTGQILLSSPSGLDMCEPSIMTRLNHNGTYAVVAFWRAHGWRLWHLATNSWLAFAEPIFVGGTSFTRDDQHVAILAHSSVQLWNMDGDLVLDTDRDPSHDLGNVMDLALSQDGERYVIGGPEILTGLMEEYSAPRSIRVGDGGSDMARAVAVGHDADLIAASLYPLETATALYDIDTGRRLVALPHHLTDIWPRLEFSPDGSLLLDFSEIGTVLIWGLR